MMKLKADSLNAGIEYARKGIIVTLDADSILDRDALKIISNTFQDEDIVAGGGTVYILQGYNGEKFSLKLIVRLQILEYMKEFLICKSSLSKMKALSIISGAFGIFRKEVLLKVGGYRDTIGEDIDITMWTQEYVMRNNGERVVYIPEAKCYTECPESWRDLTKQRIRWQKAFIDCVVQYKSLILTRFFHPLTIFFLVHAFFVDTVGTFLMIGYVVTLLVVPLKRIWLSLILFLLALSSFINIVYSVTATVLGRRYGVRYEMGGIVHLVVTMVMELTVYRMYLLFMLLTGTILYFVNKEGWNKIQRTGRVYDLNVS